MQPPDGQADRRPLLDAHNHLQFAELVPWEERILRDLRAENIVGGVVNGTRPGDWTAVREFCDRNPGFLPSFGVHPWWISEVSDGWENQLEKFLGAGGCVGETGLDAWKNPSTLELQIPVFRRHLEMAVAGNLPLTIHCLRAWPELLRVLRSSRLPERGFLLHAFGGPRDMVPELLELGGRFSFSATFLAKNKAHKLDTFLSMPPDRMFLETDAPSMLPPKPFRPFELPASGNDSAPHHPANLRAACIGLAERLGESPDCLAARTMEATRDFFSWRAEPGLA